MCYLFGITNRIILLKNNYIKKETFSSHIKSLLSLKLTEIDNNLLKGGDEYIEFMRLAYDFSKIINS